MPNNKVLVTGGAGYIGSHTVQALVDQKYEPFVLDDLSVGTKASIPSHIEFIKGDIGNQELVQSILQRNKIETIIHFAALSKVDESVREPLKYYTTNVSKSTLLLEVAKRCEIKNFIFSSTAAVYGQPKHLPVTEESPTSPVSPYGKSKLMVENILWDLGQTDPNFRFVILRYFNAAGANINPLTGNTSLKNGQYTVNATHLIKVACEVACGKRPYLEVFGLGHDTPDGSCIRDFIHVDDLATAHIKAIEYLGNNGESDVFNCGVGTGFSVQQVISSIKKISGVDFDVREVDARPGDVPLVYSSCEKIRSVLGWKPKYFDLDIVCRSAFEWESRQKNLESKDI